MKFKCNKCQQILTKDLFKSKTIEIEEKEEDDLYFSTSSIVKKGTYAINKYNKKNYLINPEDFIDSIQLNFISGSGCCGNSHVELFCEFCKTEIGFQSLDCYETKTLSIYKEKVDFEYSTIKYDFILKSINNPLKYWNSNKGWVDIEDAQKYSKYHIQKKIFQVEGTFEKII